MDKFKEVEYTLYKYFLQKVGNTNLLYHKTDCEIEYIYIPTNRVVVKIVPQTEGNKNKYFILESHKEFLRSIRRLNHENDRS